MGPQRVLQCHRPDRRFCALQQGRLQQIPPSKQTRFYNQSMSVFTLGLNHTTAPVDLRGRFALTFEQLAPALQTFRHGIVAVHRSEAPPEAAIISTCNRTELYCAADPRLVRPAMEWLAGVGGVGADTLHDHSYVLEGSEAARHAFRVASGLDSMVLGEAQILGQMKQAVREADTAGTLGRTLHQLFQRSFSVAKEVRTSTEIGAHSISMAAASVRLASQLFEDLREIRDPVRRCRRDDRAGRDAFRSQAAGQDGDHQPHDRARGSARRRLRRRIDAAVGPAGAPARVRRGGVLHREHPAADRPRGGGECLEARRRRPMFMVDLAVPRDIEPEVAKLDDVYLYTVDDLSAIVQTAGEKRQAAVAQAEAIIDSGVQSFVHWLGQRSTVPLIQALHSQADDWRQVEIARAQKLLARGDSIEAVLDALSKGLTQKMLHGTLAELQNAAPEQRTQLAGVVSRLFLRGAATGPGAASGTEQAVAAPGAGKPGEPH